MALDHGVGAVAHHGQHALVAEARNAASSVTGPISGCGVQLEVTGVQDRAVRRADDQRLCLGHRVRDGHEVQVERRHLEPAAGLDDGDLRLALQAGLAQLAAQHGGGEGGGVDRAAQLAPEMRHRADMVLVRVGDHQRRQAVAAVGDEGRVGHHDLDLRVFRPAEADAAIDGQPAAVAAVKVEVHTDLARPAQRQEGQVVGHCIQFNRFLWIVFDLSPMWGRGCAPPTGAGHPGSGRDRYAR